MRKPLRDGDPTEHYTFGVRLSEHLGVVPMSDERYRRSVDEYGPYNEATVTLVHEAGKGLVWNSDQENRAKNAALWLSPVNRVAFRVQDWWNEQERILPFYTKLSAFIAGLIVGAVISRLFK